MTNKEKIEISRSDGYYMEHSEFIETAFRIFRGSWCETISDELKCRLMTKTFWAKCLYWSYVHFVCVEDSIYHHIPSEMKGLKKGHYEWAAGTGYTYKENN